MARLMEKYRKEITGALAKKIGRSNPMDLPRLDKICLNMGLGASIQNPRVVDQAQADLTNIAGQLAVITIATKSVSNFKVREGMRVGCRVTLRGRRMYEFVDRLFNIAMPRIRDFRGVSLRSFDKAGNYSFGIEEQTIFPEIEPDKAEFTLGMDITFVIRNSRGSDESRELLRMLGMPFVQPANRQENS